MEFRELDRITDRGNACSLPLDIPPFCLIHSPSLWFCPVSTVRSNSMFRPSVVLSVYVVVRLGDVARLCFGPSLWFGPNLYLSASDRLSPSQTVSVRLSVCPSVCVSPSRFNYVTLFFVCPPSQWSLYCLLSRLSINQEDRTLPV